MFYFGSNRAIFASIIIRTNKQGSKAVMLKPSRNAGIAQLAEQVFCKHQVSGSIPFFSSINPTLKIIHSGRALGKWLAAGKTAYWKFGRADKCGGLENR